MHKAGFGLAAAGLVPAVARTDRNPCIARVRASSEKFVVLPANEGGSLSHRRRAHVEKITR